MTATQQSPLFNQGQLKIVCDNLCEKIENLLDILGLTEIKFNGKMLVGPCPIHGGDNNTAFNLYPDGDYYRGNWKCRTHNCHEVFKSSIIGFIRGVLSHQTYNWQDSKSQMVSFQETMKFIQDFLGDTSYKKISNTEVDKQIFSSVVRNIIINKEDHTNLITRHQIKQSLEIPSQYFINRGFSNDILIKYDVGLCSNPNKEMYNRAVAPIYDITGKFMVGCTGRSIFDKCDNCKHFHNPIDSCPSDNELWRYSKWKHNKDFKTQNHLYNLWNAKKHILESSKVILVESPGNVWRLEEAGIHNSVALFGSNLSDKQKILLDGSGAMTLIIIMDNDDAGHKATKTIMDKCKNTYNIVHISIEKNDIADMTIEEINQTIKKHI
jgi:5S rRNA maturation endonuclease (ribonuclease M5)